MKMRAYLCMCMWLLILCILPSCELFEEEVEEPDLIYSAFPDITRLKDGRLMCVYYLGEWHLALPKKGYRGGKIMMSFSEDEGTTWSTPQVLFDGPNDDRDPSITQLPNGDLICTFFALGEKWTRKGTWVIKSDDLGKTWGKPIRVAENYAVSSPIRVLDNGDLILGMYRFINRELGMVYNATTYSQDNGKTWSEPRRIIDCCGEGYTEISLANLGNETLYAAMRSEHESMVYSFSYDNGRSWERAEPIGFRGHCPYAHVGTDGTVYLAYRIPFTQLRFSTDNCKSWSKEFLIDGVVGAYPSMVNLNDGGIMVVYYEDVEYVSASVQFKKFYKVGDNIIWSDYAYQIK